MSNRKHRKIDIVFALAEMSLDELLELRAMVDSSIAAAEMQQRAEELGLEADAERGESAKSDKSGKAAGYVELKLINGYGPYAYRRVRVNGKLTSEYIGKVRE